MAKEGTGFDDSDVSPGHSVRWSSLLHPRGDQSIAVGASSPSRLLSERQPSITPTWAEENMRGPGVAYKHHRLF